MTGPGIEPAAEPPRDGRRAGVGRWLGPVVFALVLAAPIPGLEGAAHRLAALMAWMLVYWVTETIPLPVTAVAGAAGAVALGIGSAAAVFSAFGDPVVFLFLGSFLLAKALRVHGLDRRLTALFLSLPGVAVRPWTMVAAFAVTAAGFSMWVSNTATTAMLLPLALGLAGTVEPTGDGATAALLLLLAWSASVGGIGTPVGSPPNLIGLALLERLAGVRLGFLEWMLVAIPLLAVMLAGLLALVLAPGSRIRAAWPPGAPRALLGARGPWTAGERNTCAVFCVTVALWLLPGLVALAAGEGHPLAVGLRRLLPESVAAVLGASLLFVLPAAGPAGRFTLGWREAATIDWGTLLLFGGGLAMGRLMAETGLAAELGRAMAGLPLADSLWGLTAWAIALAILLSEAASNTASASVLVPVVTALAQSLGVNPVPPVLGATLGASYGFMLPVSTPPNAIVYGSGHVPLSLMVRMGLAVDVLGFLVILGGLRVLCPLLGLAS